MNNKDMPAMPIFGESGYISTDYIGMTKREMFAMAAMQSYITKIHDEKYVAGLLAIREIPRLSWEMADAMLDKEG